MKTTQEEADILIVQQVAEVKAKKVLVVADDTGIFVLLVHLRWHSILDTCLDGFDTS